MSEEIEFEDEQLATPEPVSEPQPGPEVVEAQAPEPVKRRGRQPKAKAEDQEAPSQTPNKIIVQTRYPYAMHCPTQNVYIPASTPVEVEPDYWIQSQIDAGLLKVLK
jgi:hypothetical protein